MAFDLRCLQVADAAGLARRLTSGMTDLPANRESALPVLQRRFDAANLRVQIKTALVCGHDFVLFALAN